jgi:hypothetical protein
LLSFEEFDLSGERIRQFIIDRLQFQRGRDGAKLASIPPTCFTPLPQSSLLNKNIKSKGLTPYVLPYCNEQALYEVDTHV